MLPNAVVLDDRLGLITDGVLAVPVQRRRGLSFRKAAGRAVSLLLAEELQSRGVTVRTLTVVGTIAATPGAYA